MSSRCRSPRSVLLEEMTEYCAVYRQQYRLAEGNIEEAIAAMPTGLQYASQYFTIGMLLVRGAPGDAEAALDLLHYLKANKPEENHSKY